jgi:predicted DNA-binding protein
MDFDNRLSNYRESNPDVKQLTLRISKEHAKKLKKLAREKRLKEGACLRLLVEFAIDEITDYAAPGEKKAGSKDTVVSVDEFKGLEELVKAYNLQLLNLEKQVNALKKQLDILQLK